MKGLLLKDILNLKSQAKIFAFLAVFYMIVGIFSEDGGMFAGFIIIIAMMLPVSALSYDERSKWDRYALTMPLTRKMLVREKYILGAAVLGCATLMGIIILIGINRGLVAEALISSLAIAGAALIYLSVMMPVLYKFGTEKGRILMIAMIAAPFAIAGALGSWFSISGGEIDVDLVPFLNVGRIILFGVGIIIYMISYLVSVKIYSKKEF